MIDELVDQVRVVKPQESSPANRQSSSVRERARVLIERDIGYIPNDSFNRIDSRTDQINDPTLRAVEEDVAYNLMPSMKGLPAHLMRMCETPVMSSEQEKEFFRRYNLLKHQANSLQSTLGSQSTAASELDAIEDLLKRAERIRNYIIQANVRLVMSIAKKFSDAKNVFDDLLSEGITSLMHAVEKFDFDRGFRFSTYATTSIQRELYRFVIKNSKQRDRFNTNAEEVFAAVPGESEGEPVGAVRNGTYSNLVQMLEQLDPREKKIIRQRFGFDTDCGRKRTYTSLGQELGISKERVRQLAERALGKLRVIATELEPVDAIDDD